jgi:hypothetical protein
MNRLERTNDLLVALQTALRGWQPGLWTALPAIVQSYNAEKLTVEAQPAIKAKALAQDGTYSDQNLPLCVDCPVQWPGGGGYLLTFPIAAGDEGILVFANRCIDSWWQSGGVQTQAELRMHDLSDGIFIPLIFSNGKVPQNVSTDAVQLRSNDGTVKIEIAAEGKVNIVAPGGVFVTGDLSITGGLNLGGQIHSHEGGTYAGDIRTAGDVVAKDGGASVGLSTHTHTQPNDTHGDAEQPTNAPTGGT